MAPHAPPLASSPARAPSDAESSGRSTSRSASPPAGAKRKRADPAHAELEVDIDAPEPPSKKALRRAKKGKPAQPKPRSPEPGPARAADASSGDEEGGPAPKPRKKSKGARRTDNDEADGAPATTDAGTAADAAATAAPRERSEFAVWIGNLPWSASKETLRAFLTEHAGIADADMTRVHLPTTAPTRNERRDERDQLPPRRKNKGFAYVDFASLGAQQAAIGVSEVMMGGRRVLVKDAQSFAGRPDQSAAGAAAKAAAANGRTGGAGAGAPGAADGTKPVGRRVFVGNLGFDADATALRKLFAPCGVVADAFVATFEDSGKCKGYAWVTFEESEAASAAVRGFVMVDEQEDDEGDEGSEDGVEKKTASRRRRVWVNQLYGRRLRAEFAEDPAVRYKKRFGSKGAAAGAEAAGADGKEGAGAAEGADGDEAQETKGHARHAESPRNATKPDDRRTPRKHDPRNVRPGAALAAAMSERRNTGAIVAATGTKITFD